MRLTRDPRIDPRQGDKTVLDGIYVSEVQSRVGDFIYVLNSRIGSIKPPFRTGVDLASWQQANRRTTIANESILYEQLQEALDMLEKEAAHSEFRYLTPEHLSLIRECIQKAQEY
jgi:hypothetical protein